MPLPQWCAHITPAQNALPSDIYMSHSLTLSGLCSDVALMRPITDLSTLLLLSSIYHCLTYLFIYCSSLECKLHECRYFVLSIAVFSVPRRVPGPLTG